MNRRAIFIWSLYDFANSFVFITFLLYFSKWLVVNQGLSDWWYNATYIIGSVGLVIFAPWLGSRADKFAKGRRYLTLSTIGCFVCYVLAATTAILGTSLFWPALWFGLGNFFYQLSFVFYNPLLNNLAKPEEQGRVSGLGTLANYFGQIAGVLLSLPFITGLLRIPGVDALIAPLFPATLIFFLLSLPLMFEKRVFVVQHATRHANLFSVFKGIRGLVFFMLAFFLFSDAITTLVNNFSIFTTSIFKVSDSAISLLTLIVIVAAGIGGWVWGLLSDHYGSKEMLVVILGAWVVIIPVMALAQSLTLYLAFAAVAGIFIGGTFSVSRQLLIALVPSDVLYYIFGVYAISERAATVVGPLAWAAALSFSGYRGAMLSMAIFQVVSVFFIMRVPSQKTPVEGLTS